MRAPWTHELADPAGADDENPRSRLDPGPVQDGPDPGERGAAEKRRLLERDVVRERQRRVRRHDDPFGERSDRGHPVDGLATDSQPGRPIRQRARGNSRPERLAGNRPSLPAGAALPAARRPGEDDTRSWDERRDPLPHRLDDARALVPEDHRRRSDPLTAHDVEVRAADARSGHSHQHVAGAGLVELDLDHLERVSRLAEESRPGLHG